jgi:tetratricopeptide (TPR) repeat protein
MVLRVVAAAILCGTLWVWPMRAQQGSVFAVEEALDRYAAGAHAQAVAALPFDRINVLELTAAADRWVSAGSIEAASRRARRRIGATFVLDAVWTGTRTAVWMFSLNLSSPDVDGQSLSKRPWPPRLSDLGAALPAVAWGCQLMSERRPADSADRPWWLLSVALLEEANEWATLVGRPQDSRRALPGGDVSMRDIAEGHLAHARALFADEPRWRLAESMARTAALVGASWGPSIGPSMRGLYFDGRTDVLRHFENSIRGLNTGRLNDLERDFLTLSKEPSVAADAWLHLGFLRMLRRDWAAALGHFDRAAAASTESFHRTVIDYFRGWTYERQERRDDAIAAYQRALAAAPGVQTLSSLLAAQLFLANRRAEAYEILDAGWRATPPGRDLLVAFQAGDAYLGRTFVERMRESWR